MAKSKDNLPTNKANKAEVDAFLQKVAATPPPAARPGQRGRLLFALDATASRRPTWDTAARLQAEMFRETAALGGLSVQLAFYRGFGEFKVSAWTEQTETLLRLMTGVDCLAGETQIAKVLKHARNEYRKNPVNALIFVGDSLEEDIDGLGRLAGELGILGLPCFLFHEGGDPLARFGFEQIAKLSGGACCAFDATAPNSLRDLLAAVAVYAAGGRSALKALAGRQGGAAKLLTDQMGGGRG